MAGRFQEKREFCLDKLVLVGLEDMLQASGQQVSIQSGLRDSGISNISVITEAMV